MQRRPERDSDRVDVDKPGKARTVRPAKQVDSPVEGYHQFIDGLLVFDKDWVNAVGTGLKVALTALYRLGDLLGGLTTALREHIHAGLDDQNDARRDCRCANCRQVFRLENRIAETAGTVIGILEVTTGGAERFQALDQLRRLKFVAGLGIDGDRQCRHACDPLGHIEHLAYRGCLVVGVAENRRNAGTAGRYRCKSSLLHRPRARGIPDVGQNQQVAGPIIRTQKLRLFCLTGGCSYHYRPPTSGPRRARRGYFDPLSPLNASNARCEWATAPPARISAATQMASISSASVAPSRLAAGA